MLASGIVIDYYLALPLLPAEDAVEFEAHVLLDSLVVQRLQATRELAAKGFATATKTHNLTPNIHLWIDVMHRTRLLHQLLTNRF